MVLFDPIWFVRPSYTCLLSSDWSKERISLPFESVYTHDFRQKDNFRCAGMMTSHSAPKLVSDIFTRTFVIPNDVTFIFFRKTNGERNITCFPFRCAKNRPLFI